MAWAWHFPLRIFDRNQGNKLHTKLDITRQEKLKDAAEAQVFNDVDSAYATLNSNLTLLRPYKEKYLAQAVRVRDTILFSYQHGGASLLDFLNAESDYRSVQLNYVNLVGSYLTAAAQLNQAVGARSFNEESISLFDIWPRRHLCMRSGVLCLPGATKARPIPRLRLRRRRRCSPIWTRTISKSDHPEQFPLVTAVEYKAAPALNVTGVVQPDICARGAGDFAGCGAGGGGEGTAGRCGEKRPVADEGAEQRCFRSLPDLSQSGERRVCWRG